MSDEFQKMGPNTVTSIHGFTVAVNYARDVKYVDGEGGTRIEIELLVNPYRILLYSPRDTAALERFERILPNLRRALDYMECRFELW
jgi:hypothetical protein